MKKIYTLLLILGMFALGSSVYGQEQPKPSEEEVDLFDLSLEELMNVPINSASKRDETLFDAPLSSYTITRAEIERSGTTSIMEALRLAPGVIVREQANGMYDIHIRGMENLVRNNGTFFKTNSYTLVMIDNRPVFNHGLGGTYWESLPIDLNDVERIEIVRGPSSPLFGPNAVTGVINIITRKMGENSTLVSSNVQAGTLGTQTANLSVGKKLSDKFSAIISGNFQNRQRPDSKYFRPETFDGEVTIPAGYYDLDQILDPTSAKTRYPNPERALNKWGVNGYFQFKPSETVQLDWTISAQGAEFQKVFIDVPLIDGNTSNFSTNLNAKIKDFTLRTSYLSGHNIDARFTLPWAEYNFDVLDLVAEYGIKIGDKSTITPGFSYQNVNFDDSEYHNPQEGRVGFFAGEKQSLNTIAGYVRGDFAVTDDLRVLGGLRVDKFSAPDKAYLAYELATTYKINERNLLRAAITRSNSGSFLGYNFLNLGGARLGNDNLKLFTLNMVEVGYRVQLGENFQIDLDVFRQKGENITAIVQSTLATFPQVFSNIPTTAIQHGFTIAFNYVPNEKIQFKPFFTFQQSETKDLPSLYLNPNLIPGLVTYEDKKNFYTPGSYGGFYLNYRPSSKINFNINSYYFSKQKQYDNYVDDGDANDTDNEFNNIKGKIILSAKLSYNITPEFSVYVNARNLTNSKSVEFYSADYTRGLYLVGISYNLMN